jgi:prepilin-type N-terminal cleavage/methylation domain-containing protein
MRTHISRRDQAFTAIEVLIVIGVIALLAALLLPSLASTGRGSTRIVCVSNMKQASLAFIVWAHDNEKNNLPFRVPFWEGGTQVPTTPFPTNATAPESSGQQNDLWFQCAWVSNLLSSPKVLVCPSDKEKKPALNWSTAKAGGFRNANYQDRAVSYNLWPDAGITGGKITFEQKQEEILLSDRNLNADSPATVCSSGNNSARMVFSNTMTVGWQTEKKFGHGAGGGLALLDGSVSSVGNDCIRTFFKSGTDNGSLHYISPQ